MQASGRSSRYLPGTWPTRSSGRRARFLALLLALAVPHQRLPAQVVASDSLLTEIRSAQAAFFSTWRSHWLVSQAEHHSLSIQAAQRIVRITRPDGHVDLVTNRIVTHYTLEPIAQRYPVRRLTNIACGNGPEPRDYGYLRPFMRSGRWPSEPWGSGWSIHSGVASFRICPTWYLGPESLPPWDERLGLDAALGAAHVDSVRRARAQFIDVLQRSLHVEPANKWLRGQLVRMLVDQRALPAADSVASDCTSDGWWCGLLRGYVASASPDPAAAEQFYRSALRAMPAANQCALSGLAELLDPDTREWYDTLSCAQRDSVNRVAWWLSDPLWIDGSNDRFAEHYTRRMLLELKLAASHDERFDWRPESGNDARAEMVLRYGWPAYVFWAGPLIDSSMSSQLRRQHTPALPNPPYVSYEYGGGRLHVFPAGNVLRSPLTAEAGDWSLRAPPGGDTVIHWVLPENYQQYDNEGELRRKTLLSNKAYGHWLATYSRYVRETLWWPFEHYASSQPIMQLPTPDVAFLRRHTHAVLATALRLDVPGPRKAPVVEGVTLVVSPSPDSMMIGAVADARPGDVVRLHASIPTQRALLGIEYAQSRSGDAAGRTRFAIAPPPALSAMRPGEYALSDIILLTPSSSGRELPGNLDTLLALMAPSPLVDRGTGIGLYWESYGFAPQDSLTIEVRVRRTSADGFLNRVGQAMGVAGDRNTPIGIRWKEEQRAVGAVVVDDGPVPIVGRRLLLALDRAARGQYTIEISVTGQRGASATNSRRIEIR
jgi:hypothetical protein